MALSKDHLPTAVDPFAGVTPAPAAKPRDAKSLVISSDDPLFPFFENDGALLMERLDAYENEANAARSQAKDAEAKAAEALAAKADAEAAAEAMRQKLAQAGPGVTYKPVQGLLPGAMGVTPFPGFKPGAWAAPVLALLTKTWGGPVIGLQGPAGVGKTFLFEQWSAANGIALFFVKGHGQDPWRMIEYQEAKGGQTHYRPGPLTEAVQEAAKHPSTKCLVLIDELCTTGLEFQLKLAGLFELPGSRKLETTEMGIIPVPHNVQFCWTANATGFNPQSRHRGTIAPPILNRSLVLPVPPLTEADITAVLTTKCPATKPQDHKRVAIIVTRLAAAASAGQLDLEATIRTAIQVCELSELGLSWAHAWDLAYTGKIDEPSQAAAARGIIKEQF